MKKLFSLLFLMGCAAELNTTDNNDSPAPPPEPPEFGVNEREDCDQAAIG